MIQPKITEKKRKKVSIKEPKQYHVIMHNDDVTMMEFVVAVLITVFFKTQKVAEKIMMTIHTEGQAIVGTYSYDIAQSKIRKVELMAEEAKFPLRCSIKEA